MKGLALCGVLVCGLAVVLVCAASNGLGMLSPSFAPVKFVPLEGRSQSLTSVQPAVEDERSNVQPGAVALNTPPAPEVTIERVVRRHPKIHAKLAQPTTTTPVIAPKPQKPAPKPA